MWNLGLVTSVYRSSRLWISSFNHAGALFADWCQIDRAGAVSYLLQRLHGEVQHSGDHIAPQWAAQRIKGLSLKTAVLRMLLPSRGKDHIKSLIEEFEYPQLGPGEMWEAFARQVTQTGGDIRLNSRVVALHCDGGRITAVDVESEGTRYRQPVANGISTMVRQLVQADAGSTRVVEAATSLKYATS